MDKIHLDKDVVLVGINSKVSELNENADIGLPLSNITSIQRFEQIINNESNFIKKYGIQDILFYNNQQVRLDFSYGSIIEPVKIDSLHKTIKIFPLVGENGTYTEMPFMHAFSDAGFEYLSKIIVDEDKEPLYLNNLVISTGAELTYKHPVKNRELLAEIKKFELT